MKKIDLEKKVSKDDNEIDNFDIDSEYNLDLAYAKGILLSLNGFKNSKTLKKRQLKSFTFLALTNDVQKDNIDSLMENSKFVNGLNGKQWIKLVNIICNASYSRKELKNEIRNSRFFNR